MARSLRFFALVLLLAAACGGKPATTSGTITLQMSGDPAEAEAYRSLTNAFSKAVPNIKVNLVVVPSATDHVAKLVTSFSGGKPPDLFLINYRRFGQFAARGVLEPMAPRLSKSDRIKIQDFYPQPLEAFIFGGALQCMPTNISNQVVYYNAGLFSQFGVTPPPQGGWRWDQLLATAKRMTRDTNGDGKTDVYGLGVPPEFVSMAPFVWQAGGEVVNDVTNPAKTTMLGPKELKALKFFIELRRVHKVVPSHAEFESEGLEERFARGGLGMLIESRRATTALRGVPGLDWDVAPLAHDAEPATMLHTDAFCMAKASTQKDAAFRFVEFALGPEGAPILARTGRTVPSHIAVANSDAFLTPGTKPAHAKVFLDQIPLIHRFPNIAAWNEIENKANPIIEEWFFGPERIEALGIEIDLATRELFAEKRPSPAST
jgi:multiple sugar transport system substrate-binding protein